MGRVDPAMTLKVIKKIIDRLENGEPPKGEPSRAVVVQMETCAPCNEEHPKGEPCSKCGRSLLLG